MHTEREERRHSVRALADCPAMYRMMDPNGPKRVEAQKSGRYPIPVLPRMDTAEKLYKKLHGQTEHASDPDVMELLLWLDWKISFMIKALPQGQDEVIFPNRTTVKDLSADGLKVHVAEAPKLGDLLELELILPVLPFREMFLAGEVMWLNPKAESVCYCEVGLAFRGINWHDQEHIISYVVKRQMQLQRERQK